MIAALRIHQGDIVPAIAKDETSKTNSCRFLLGKMLNATTIAMGVNRSQLGRASIARPAMHPIAVAQRRGCADVEATLHNNKWLTMSGIKTASLRIVMLMPTALG